MMALVMAITVASAQTVEHSSLLQNTYVTVSGGVVTNTQFTNFAGDNWYKVSPVVGLELGKYITPVVGVSVEGLGFINTTTSKTIFDESLVLANGKVNFSNWFGGYKGQPRRVEVVGVLGYGWGHDYVSQNAGQYRSSDTPLLGGEEVIGRNDVSTDKNYIAYKAGAALNFNIGKQRAWQINVRPSVLWFHKVAGDYVATPFNTTKRDARIMLQAGLTYKFGSKDKGHNFRLCPYAVTQADYDAALNQIKELENQEPKVVEKVIERVVERQVIVEKQVPREPALTTVITFPIGSTQLSSVERAKLGVLAKTIKPEEHVYLVGSADSATGSEQRNTELCIGRSDTVKAVLVNEYNIAEERITVTSQFDTADDPEASRAVVITLK